VPRILLVDDDIAEISAVKRVLARSGHQPVLATNASDALAAIGQAPPDLLVVGSTCENGEALAMAARVAAGEAGVAPMSIVVLGEAAGSPARAAVGARP
jgi:PleD family two-component response regulator